MIQVSAVIILLSIKSGEYRVALKGVKRWPGIDGRVALVTGATRGIGRAVADALALEGALVIGTATKQEGVATINERLKSQTAPGYGVELDVSDHEAVSATLDRISTKYGPPSILVNNAGIVRDNLMIRMKNEDWDQVISTNLSSHFYVAKACLRGMIKARWGRIINISSVVGLTGNAGQTNYASAKAGIIGFTKSLAQEVASRNITVNSIAPGFVNTDMTSQLDQTQTESLCLEIPARRLGVPADIAAAVVFLVSDSAGYITGETLNISGGLFIG